MTKYLTKKNLKEEGFVLTQLKRVQSLLRTKQSSGSRNMKQGLFTSEKAGKQRAEDLMGDVLLNAVNMFLLLVDE